MIRNYFLGLCYIWLLSTQINSALGQGPSIQWQKSFGGSEDDEGADIIPTRDGNFIAIGYSRSNDGDITFHHSSATISDMWLVKINPTGTIIWNKSLGGSSGEDGYSILQTNDNGFILLGYSSSNNFDVTGNHGGSSDVWLVKTDSIGQIQWQRSYGTFESDRGYQIKQTTDSGFIFLAMVSGNDGDVTDLHNYHDLWVVKINSIGQFQWRRCLGGGNYDTPGSIIVLSDGNYIASGSILSTDGDITCTDPSRNVWIVKLAANGSILWDRCYGGTNSEMVIDLLNSSNNGFYVAAATSSNDGDVNSLIGIYNCWILKCDSSGSIIWEKCFGGTQIDFVSSISSTFDDGLIISGYSTSPISGNHGMKDAYIFKIDTLGNLIWQKCFGGSMDDEANSVFQTADSGYMFVGYTESIDGDVTYNHGRKDLWAVKLGSTQVSIDEVQQEFANFQINQNETEIIINFIANNKQQFELVIYNLLGYDIFSTPLDCVLGENSFFLPFTLSPGIMIVKIHNLNGNITKKVAFY